MKPSGIPISTKGIGQVGLFLEQPIGCCFAMTSACALLVSVSI